MTAGDRFVVNDKSMYGVQAVLHDSSCHTLQRADANLLRGFEDADAAESWLADKLGWEGRRWRRCGVCEPVNDPELERLHKLIKLGMLAEKERATAGGPDSAPRQGAGRGEGDLSDHDTADMPDHELTSPRPESPGRHPNVDPWLQGPIEILQVANANYKSGTDTGRRQAVVGFDNAVEISVATFVNLHPRNRRGIMIPREQVEKGRGQNFHEKVEFLEWLVDSIGRPLGARPEDLVWYHDLRNRIYHAGNGVVPSLQNVVGSRTAALAVFRFLFDLDPEEVLK
jgi:hypothetical protein